MEEELAPPPTGACDESEANDREPLTPRQEQLLEEAVGHDPDGDTAAAPPQQAPPPVPTRAVSPSTSSHTTSASPITSQSGVRSGTVPVSEADTMQPTPLSACSPEASAADGDRGPPGPAPAPGGTDSDIPTPSRAPVPFGLSVPPKSPARLSVASSSSAARHVEVDQKPVDVLMGMKVPVLGPDPESLHLPQPPVAHSPSSRTAMPPPDTTAESMTLSPRRPSLPHYAAPPLSDTAQCYTPDSARPSPPRQGDATYSAPIPPPLHTAAGPTRSPTQPTRRRHDMQKTLAPGVGSKHHAPPHQQSTPRASRESSIRSTTTVRSRTPPPTSTRAKTPPSSGMRKRKMGVGEAAGIRLSMTPGQKLLQQQQKQKAAEALMAEGFHQAQAHHAGSIEEMRREMTRLHHEELIKYESELMRLRDKVQDAEVQKEAVCNSLQEAHESNSVLVSRLHEAHSRIDALEKVREEDTARWLETVEAWRKHLDQTNRQARRDRETLEIRVAAYEQTLQHSKDVAEAAQREETRTMRLENELAVSQQQLKEATASSVAMMEELEGARRLLLDRTAELSAGTEQLALLQNMVSGLRSELTRAQSERGHLEARCCDLEQALEQAADAQDALQAAVATTREEGWRAIEKVASDQSQELQALKLAHEAEVAKLRMESKSRIEEHEEEISGIRHDLATAVHRHETEMVALRSEYEEVIQRLTRQHECERAADQKTIADLHLELKDAEIRYNSRQMLLEQLQAEWDDRLAKKAKEQQAMATDLAAAQQSLRVAEAEHMAQLRNATALEKQVDELQRSLRDTQNRLMQAERAVVAAEEKETMLHRQASESAESAASAKERLHTTNGYLEQHKAQLAQAHRKLETLTGNLQAAERQSKRCMAENDRMRAEITVKDAQIEEMRAKTVQLQIEVQQLRIKFVDGGRRTNSPLPKPPVPKRLQSLSPAAM